MLTLGKRPETMTLLSPKVSLSDFLLPSFYLYILAYEKAKTAFNPLLNSTPTFRQKKKSSKKKILSALTGKQRLAHTPNSKPKLDAVLDLKEEDEENEGPGGDGGSRKGILTEEELWARLDELEKLEELQDEQDR